ncbi:MAG: hypothetical protein U0P81_02840 [Holophagaceae bacterium]
MLTAAWIAAAAGALGAAGLLRRRARRARAAAMPPPGRPMGSFERLFDCLHPLGGFVVVVAARVAGPLDERLLEKALADLQDRHPLLRVKVAGPGGCFEAGAGPIPLRTPPRRDAASWKAVAAEELHRPIPHGPDPLIRAVWLGGEGGGELILTANHAILDGLSCLAVLRGILQACVARQQGLAPEAVASTRVPALDDGLPPGARGRLPPPRRERPLAWDGKAGPAERRSRVDYLALSPAETAALADRCRAEGTTVHGAVSAAALLAFREALGPGRPLVLTSNVNLRPLLAPPVEEGVVGCFISGVSTRHAAGPDVPFWDLAREVRAEVAAATARGEPLRAAARPFRPWMAFLARHLLPRVGQGRLGDVNVSNLGRSDVQEPGGPLRLVEAYCMASQHAVGHGLQVGLWTLDGTLFATLTHVAPLLSPARAEVLARTLLGLLRRAGAAGDFTLGDGVAG